MLLRPTLPCRREYFRPTFRPRASSTVACRNSSEEPVLPLESEFVDLEILKAVQPLLKPMTGPLQYTFGVISDIQHADIPDGHSYHGVPRFYRNAKVALERAVSNWKAAGQVSFAVHFGDIIDGFQPKDRSEEVLEQILQEFDKLGKPVYHMLGNHCLVNLPRKHLNQKLGIHGNSPGTSYYAFKPHPGWRVLVVDAYDVSALGWPEGHPLRKRAEQILEEKNPNENKNSPEGLEGVARRWVKFNGGASAAQVAWLKDQLKEAQTSSEKVLVFSHLPVMPGTCPNACLLWNFEEVLGVLRDASDVVVATFAGHTHQNGYLLDEWGIHHVVLPAVLETPPGRDCYGQVEVYGDKVVLRGVDCMMSLELPVMADQKQHLEATAPPVQVI